MARDEKVENMLVTSATLFISMEFKTLLTRGNKYEDYVLEIMNKSSCIFPNVYKKIEKQDNGQPDYIDITNNDCFDAKMVVSESQCKQLCGNNNFESFFEEIVNHNNELYNCCVDDNNMDISIEKIIRKQLEKKSTKNKNIVFFFTFPIGCDFAQSITSPVFPNYYPSSC